LRFVNFIINEHDDDCFLSYNMLLHETENPMIVGTVITVIQFSIEMVRSY